MKDHLDKVSFLTQEDLNFMYEQAFLFQEWKRGLYNMHDISQGLSTPHYDEKNYHISMELKKELRYAKRKLIEKLEKVAENTAQSFVSSIVWYLEKKYNMDIDVECTEEMSKRSDWKEQDYIQEIIEQLKGQFGDVNADRIRLQQLSDKIMDKEPVANGRILEFPSKYAHSWRVVGRTIRTDFIALVLSVVSYQEKITFDLPDAVKWMLEENYEDSYINSLSSVEKYRVYKNGKLTITFSSNDSLASFIETVKLNQTKNKN